MGESLSNHPNDQEAAVPTVDSIPAELGSPEAVASDSGFFSAANIEAFERRDIDPYIATGLAAPHGHSAHRAAALRALRDREVPLPSSGKPPCTGTSARANSGSVRVASTFPGTPRATHGTRPPRCSH